jgi:hypothetical protein
MTTAATGAKFGRATEAELAYLRANYRRYGDGPACALVLGWGLGRVRYYVRKLRLRSSLDPARVLAYLACEPRTAAEVAEVAGCDQRLASHRLRRWWLAGKVRPVPIRSGRGIRVLWAAGQEGSR